MGPYYVVLRSVLRSRPKLRPCLSRCRHCRIFFLTHPRNGGRWDLRCPFGCKEAHRKRRSTERSVEYYGTEEGKGKKKQQNGKRSQGETPADHHRRVALASIAQRGIEEPLEGMDSAQCSILLNGFKRYRCASKLGIGVAPYASLGGEEATAILNLLRMENAYLDYFQSRLSLL